jgi:hypothetical protein
MVNLRFNVFLSPELSLLHPASNSPRDNISKNSLLGITEDEVHLQYLLRADNGQQTLVTRRNYLFYFFPLGLIWAQGV